MTDPVIHSKSWTGPIQTDVPTQQTIAFVGKPWVPTDAERAKWAEPVTPMAQQVRRWAKLVGLVFLSPLLLLVSWWFAHAASPDELWSDRREWLFLWGLALVGVFARELHAWEPVNAGRRSGFLALVLSSTLAFSIWYPYAVLTARDAAIASQPERTYELYYSWGRNCGYYVHQRADGTTIEGTWVGDPVPYGSTCTLVQRLEGDHGFSWIRVLDRSPPPAHELIWPIRREDCFSNKPLAVIRT
jgi:hypothetical protein